MRVLLTGANGFLGKEIFQQLSQTMKVISLGKNGANDLIVDITKRFSIEDNSFGLVIHCAGKAHVVPRTDEEKRQFEEVNFEGTKNLLNSIEPKSLKGFVLISTVAVYGCEIGAELTELTPINGATPYAQSKISAENAANEWGIKYNVPVLILRLPLITGTNPPGNLEKMVNAIKKGIYFGINGSKAKRSLISSSDVARCIRDNIGASGTYNLTDGYHARFRDIELIICKQLNKRKPLTIPLTVARMMGALGDLMGISYFNRDTVIKMTQDLTFNNKKALSELDWVPNRATDSLKVQ